ncbi:unnamed protein product [Ectocarpus sp. 8 AP-2014]
MRRASVVNALTTVLAAACGLRSAAFVYVAPSCFSPSSPLLARSSVSGLRPALGRSVSNDEEYPAGSARWDEHSRCSSRLSAETNGIYPDGVPNLPGIKTIVETEEEEEQRAVREWQDDGRKGRVLVRRKEIPSPAMDPASVCQLVFESLQNNDDPMLDYGAAVAVKFASSKSAVRNMTPAEYGAFLRNDPDQVLLVDNASCAPAERAKVSADGKQVLQKVEVVGRYPDVVRRIVEVQLTKEEDDCWRVDAMTFGPNVEQRK